MTCGTCHSWRQCHPDLPPEFQDDDHGLCCSPWQPHRPWHKDSTACTWWEPRETERLLRECPSCGQFVWKWLRSCPQCKTDLRARCPACGLPTEGEPPLCRCPRPRHPVTRDRRRDHRGGQGHGWLATRRAGEARY